MKTCNNMNIIVQTTGGDASSLNVNSESPNNTLDNNTRYIIMNQVTRKKFGDLPIIIPYVSLAKMRRDCVEVLLNSFGMEQDLHTNISRYGA